MPNYNRYSAIEPWRLDNAELDHTDDNGIRTIIVVEVADLKDKQTGDVFTDGAWRVRFARTEPCESGAVKVPAPKTKTYFGETASHSAIRYANDAHWALRIGKEVPAR